MRILYKIIELTYQPREGVDLSDILNDMFDAWGAKAFDSWIEGTLQATGCGSERCDSHIDWQR